MDDNTHDDDVVRDDSVDSEALVGADSEEAVLDEPPVEEPIAEEPPADEPPFEEPPVEEPIAEEPPADEPPFEEPPAESGDFEDAAGEDAPVESDPASAESGQIIGDESVSDDTDADLKAISSDLDVGDAASADAQDGVDPNEYQPTTLLPALTLDDSSEVPDTETPLWPADMEGMVGDVGMEPAPLLEGAADAAAVTEPAPETGAAVPPVFSEMDLGPERRGGKMWIWIGLAVGVLIMAGALGYAYWYTNARPIGVPDVVGRLPAQATQALNDAGLRVGRVSEIPTDTAPAGTVIEQKPKVGAKLKPGEAVSLIVAAASEMAKVPDVVGRSADEAVETLANQRLAARVVNSYSATAAVGYVLTQVPTATAEMDPGSVVVLIASAGTAPTSSRVPQLVGLRETDATALLSTLEVRVGVYRSYDSSVAAGVILAQTPAPDAQVDFDGVVQYLVSKGSGSASVRMPNVVSQTEKDAVKKLRGLGLSPQVMLQSSTTVPRGRVISQLPVMGQKTSSGENVGLIVSRGESSTVSVPDLLGKTTEQASTELTKAGFKPTEVKVKQGKMMAGQVWFQFPLAGTLWGSRYPVVYLVAQ